MGGALTCSRRHHTKTICVQSLSPYSSSAHSYGDQIDVDILFSALLKLACVFEVKESLTDSLTDEIMDPRHKSFDDQFVAVEAWLNKHGRHGAGSDLTAAEIDYLIQYVELYQPLPTDDTTVVVDSESTSARSPLICPYRSELASLTGEIRSKEAKRLSSSSWGPFPDDNTLSIRFPEKNHSVRKSLSTQSSDEVDAVFELARKEMSDITRIPSLTGDEEPPAKSPAGLESILSKEFEEDELVDF